MTIEHIKRHGNATRALQKAIDEGDQNFKNYAAYILEEMPNTTATMLREYHKHNASVREIRAHNERIRNGGQP